jgi:hypothetical protein
VVSFPPDATIIPLTVFPLRANDHTTLPVLPNESGFANAVKESNEQAIATAIIIATSLRIFFVLYIPFSSFLEYFIYTSSLNVHSAKTINNG